MEHSRRSMLKLAGLAAAAVPLAACTPPSISTGGGAGISRGQATVSAADVEKAMSTPTTLTFWTWVPNIQKEVDLFEKAYPQIKVNVVNTTSGTIQYPKLRAAIKAGKGAPDVAQIEYQYISSFRQTKSLLDLTAFGAANEKSKYVDWIWNQVADSAGVWSVPQDSGPLGNLYRTDIFEKAGISTAPETWADFAEAAAKVKEKTNSYISDLPGNDAGQMVGFFWQAGAKPFGYDGNKTVTVKIDSAETQKVVQFWQGLIKKDLIATDPDFNNDWYQGLSRGQVRQLAGRSMGSDLLAGHGQEHLRKLDGGQDPAVERRRGRLGKLGRLDGRRARRVGQPDCGLSVQQVHQLQREVGAAAGERAVLVSDDDRHPAGERVHLPEVEVLRRPESERVLRRGL